MLSPGEMTAVPRQDIELLQPSQVSVMPAELLISLQADEIQDSVAFLPFKG